MKSIVIIAIAFVLLIPLPIFAQTPQYQIDSDYHRTCKLTSDDIRTGKFIQSRYDSCINSFEKQDMWRSLKYWGLGIFFLFLFGFIGILAIKNISKPKPTYVDTDYSYTVTPVVRKGWTVDEKEKVRIRQDGKCAHCNKPPPRWEYHHVNGDRSNNSLDNCEGLCPNCHSVETHEG